MKKSFRTCGACGDVSQRDVRRADAVAAGDGREPLHVTADQPADRLCFNLAEHREFLGDVLDRAVVLADLDAERGVVHGRGVAVVGERLGERSGALVERQRRDPLGVPRLPGSHPAACEVLDRGVAGGLAEVAQGVDGDLVVRRRAGCVTGVGELKRLAGRPRPRRPVLALLAGDDDAVGERGVEMAADAGGRQAEPLGELGDRRRAVLEQRADDSIAGTAVGTRPAPRSIAGARGFHNVIIA